MARGRLTLKKGWLPDQTSTTYFSFVPLTVSTSSPLQMTCARAPLSRDAPALGNHAPQAVEMLDTTGTVWHVPSSLQSTLDECPSSWPPAITSACLCSAPHTRNCWGPVTPRKSGTAGSTAFHSHSHLVLLCR